MDFVVSPLELRNKGFLVNVRRLMDKLGLKGKRPKMKNYSYQGDLNGTTKNQLLDKIVFKKRTKTYYERNFFTHILMRNGQQMSACFVSRLGNFIFLPTLDMHNREIVAYNISESPNYAQIQDMLTKAFDQMMILKGSFSIRTRVGNTRCKPITGRFWQSETSFNLCRARKLHGQSADGEFPLDYENEMFYGHEAEFKTLDDLRHAMEEYIIYYNTKRITEKLKGLTPVEYRCQS